MANVYLFITSMLMLTCTSVSIIINNNKYIVVLYYIGSLTSVWNHGTNSNIARICDRYVMRVGALIDLYYIIHVYNKIEFILPFILAIFSFYYSKTLINNRTIWHALSHFWITVLHTLILSS